MALLTSFVVINVIINATFWRCDVHPPACYMSTCFAITAHLLAACLHPCFAIIALPTYYMSALFMFVVNFKLGSSPLTCLCKSWSIGMHNFHFNKFFFFHICVFSFFSFFLLFHFLVFIYYYYYYYFVLFLCRFHLDILLDFPKH